jgi:hypothetical protein
MYNRFVKVVRAITVSDDLGGHRSGYSTLYASVRCRLNALTTKEMTFSFEKQTVFANYYIYLEYLADLKDGDRLIDLADARTYEVKLVMEWDRAQNYMKIAAMELR